MPRTDVDIADQMVGAGGMLGAGANVIVELGRPGVGHGVIGKMPCR